MQQNHEMEKTFFHNYDSPDCWKDPEEFWAMVDKGYGQKPIPYAWQPYYRDLDSKLTHVTLSEATQPEPSIEGTVTVDTTLSHSSSFVSENFSDDSQNYFYRRKFHDTDSPSYFDICSAIATVIQPDGIEDAIDDNEYVASCSDSET
jgi:hypothetical protein